MKEMMLLLKSRQIYNMMKAEEAKMLMPLKKLDFYIINVKMNPSIVKIILL